MRLAKTALASVVLNSARMGLPFTRSAGRKRDQVIAVDFGGRTTKAVQMQRRDGKFALLDYAMVETPVWEKGATTEQIAEHLKKVTNQLSHGKSRFVTVALGVNETHFRQVEVPLMPLSDLRLMLKFNSKTYLQQDLADHVFDCFYVAPKLVKAPEGGSKAPSATGSQKHKALVGGARKQLVESWQAAIRAAGLVPDQVVPGLIGPVNAFEIAEPEIFAKETVALIDFGFKSTSITILEAGEIMLNRVVGIGGDRLTTGLAEAMNISYAEAEGIKVGIPTEVQSNLELVISPLGRELRASIDFFEHQQDKTVTQAFVSGGTARSELIVQTLQSELMVPCKSWAPTRSMEMELGPQKMGEVEQVAPQLTVAIGAGLSAF